MKSGLSRVLLHSHRMPGVLHNDLDNDLADVPWGKTRLSGSQRLSALCGFFNSPSEDLSMTSPPMSLVTPAKGEILLVVQKVKTPLM